MFCTKPIIEDSDYIAKIFTRDYDGVDLRQPVQLTNFFRQHDRFPQGLVQYTRTRTIKYRSSLHFSLTKKPKNITTARKGFMQKIRHAKTLLVK